MTLDVVVVPVLAGGDALLGPVVLDALNGFDLEVGTHSSLVTKYVTNFNDRRVIADLSGCDIGPHVSEEVLVEWLPDLHEIIGDGPLGVTHGVVEVLHGDGAFGGVIGLHEVTLQVPFSGGWLR